MEFEELPVIRFTPLSASDPAPSARGLDLPPAYDTLYPQLVPRAPYLASSVCTIYGSSLRIPSERQPMNRATSAPCLHTCPYPEHPSLSLGGVSALLAEGFIVEPTSNELMKKKIKLLYFSGADHYLMPIRGKTPLPGWRSCVYSESSICRHVEEINELNYAFLARKPGSDLGRIEWRFDLRRCGSRIEKVKILFSSIRRRPGCVNAFVVSGNQRFKLHSENFRQIFQELKGCQMFSIMVELTGTDASGRDLWQQAQLFRRSQTDNDSTWPPFKVSVTLQ